MSVPTLTTILCHFLSHHVRDLLGADLSGLEVDMVGDILLRGGSRVTKDMLLEVEARNPHLIGDKTDLIWKRFCRSKYGVAELNAKKYSSYRECYLRLERKQRKKMEKSQLHTRNLKRKIEEIKGKHITKKIMVMEGPKPPSRLSKHVAAVRGHSRPSASVVIRPRNKAGASKGRIERVFKSSSGSSSSKRNASGSSSGSGAATKGKGKLLQGLLKSSARDVIMKRKTRF